MKHTKLLFIMISLLLLTACKDEAVIQAEDLIETIGVVTENNQISIITAREAYEQLEEDDKESVSNYEALIAAEKEFDLIIANKVVELIRNIEEIDTDSKNEIENIKASYEELTEEQKSLVSNFSQFLDAQRQYDDYIVNNAIDIINRLYDLDYDENDTFKLAQETYDLLTEEQKHKVQVSIGDVEEYIQKAIDSRMELWVEEINYISGKPEIHDVKALISVLSLTNDLDSSEIDSIENYKVVEKAIKGYKKYIEERLKDDKLYARETYIYNCESIDYEEIMLYPTSYEGHNMVMDIEILEKNEGGLFSYDKYLCRIVGSDEIVELEDDREVKEPIISIGESFIAYGTIDDIRNFKVKEENSGLFGTGLFEKTSDEFDIPIMKFLYTSIDNLGIIENGDPNAEVAALDEEYEMCLRKLDQLIAEMN